MHDNSQEKTGLGNYFVANYPPFSAWKADYLAQARQAFDAPPREGVPLGLYLHIPFCRKRCKFCYFRVYTDKNARDVETYSDALVKEVSLCARAKVVGGRPLDYVYFGGGTPSYLSAAQLRDLMGRLKSVMPWEAAREVTFECEPGTLQKHKLETLKEMGVTRLSLGIENFDPSILEYNGRAHLEEEIHRAYGWAREVGFRQINIDLIAGMVGENWDNWRECVRKTAELAPESVTIYQMELPYNTTFSKELTVVGQAPTPAAEAVADWPTKRAWVAYAYDELMKSGYEVSSAYTLVRNKERATFVYRDALWHGADMFGTGVASFGHMSGVHVQNLDRWDDWLAAVDRGEIPLGRALPVRADQLLTREMILQLKTGSLDPAYFERKFGVDIRRQYAAGFEQLASSGDLTVGDAEIRLTRQGLLQVDRLLPAFFEPEFKAVRYT